MIVEMRTYTLSVGGAAQYFKAYGEKGVEVQKRILGNLVGYYSVEIGELNKVIHLWAYDSYAERDRRRALLWQDPEWLAYVREAPGLVQRQETQILAPAPFFKVPDPA